MLPGAAYDIGVGANGQMWVIGTNREGGGYGIYRWNGKKYSKIPGSGIRISVDKNGNAWVVNKHRQIYAYNGSRWIRKPGSAYDVGAGAEGTIWVIGTNRLGRGGFGIYRKSEGPYTTLWATASQDSINYNKNPRANWRLVQWKRQTVLRVFNKTAWSTGRFSCANEIVMQNDGNLVSYCFNRGRRSSKWSMVIGSGGPKRVGK